jgi:hypothetical protein
MAENYCRDDSVASVAVQRSQAFTSFVGLARGIIIVLSRPRALEQTVALGNGSERKGGREEQRVGMALYTYKQHMHATSWKPTFWTSSCQDGHAASDERSRLRKTSHFARADVSPCLYRPQALTSTLYSGISFLSRRCVAAGRIRVNTGSPGPSTPFGI